MPDIRRTGLLDDFERAAEDPLSFGGKWDKPATDSNAMKTRSGTGGNMIATNATDGGVCRAYWTPESFSEDELEVWGFENDIADGAGKSLRLFFFASVGGTVSTLDGYILLDGFEGATHKLWLRRFTNNVTITEAVIGEPFSRQYLLLRLNGNDVEGWGSADGTTWTKHLSITDTTYRSGLYLGIGAQGVTSTTGPGWGSIGGGLQAVAAQQFIRRPFG